MQKKLLNNDYYDVKSDLAERIFDTKNTIERMRYSSNPKDRKYYKRVQEYEDAVDDEKIKKEIVAFKVFLATAALAGSITLGSFVTAYAKDTYDSLKSTLKSPYTVTEYEDTSAESREQLKDKVISICDEIRTKDGYVFNNLSIPELAEGYYKIIEKEEKLSENQFEAAAFKISSDGDQQLLERVLRESLGDKYNTASPEKRREYKQFAFELLPYALPEIFENENDYVRNPIIMDELEARTSANEKGYRIRLRVNNDEKETVKVLGTVLSTINTMKQEDYERYSSLENGQQAFFDEVLSSALGENFKGIDKKDKRDYEQIIYEWLPDIGRQYIKDPIEVERQISEDIEIGD